MSGLYIHLPWCLQKCPYCDFNSHALKKDTPLPEHAYLNQLLLDLEHDLTWITPAPIKSIFIGGGTPSLFQPDTIATLLQGIRKRLPIASDVEVTMEANPSTFEYERFLGFYHAGIQRLSIGIQSFNATHLKKLGRVHDRDEAIRAIEIAQHVGFESYNLDLMYGLPGQTEKEAMDDLSLALSFSPPHLSWYQLTLEPNTYFARFPPTLPNDEILESIHFSGQDMLQSHGLNPYEISAYARQNHQCQHNINYWQYGDYLGIGAGAHGKITQHHTPHRYWKIKHPKNYLRAKGPEFYGEKQTIPEKKRPFEIMMNVLRLHQAPPIQPLLQRYQLTLNDFEPALQTAIDAQWIEPTTASSIQSTAHGRLFLNEVLALFLQQEEENASK